MKNNILIIGANYSNKGAEAMLKTVRQHFDKGPQKSLYYMLCHPGEKKLAEADGFIPIVYKKPSIASQILNLLKRIIGKLRKILRYKQLPYLEKLPLNAIKKQELDLVIDISGYAYGDFRGYPQAKEALKLIRYCNKKDIQFYFLPQAWGPFSGSKFRYIINEILTSCTGYYSRDSISTQNIKTALNQPSYTIKQCADIALTFKSAPSSLTQVSPIVDKIEIQKRHEKTIVGLSPNMRIFEKYSRHDLSNNTYLQALINIINYVSNSLNAFVLLIPNEMTYDNRTVDDRYICQLLYSKSNQENTLLMDGYYSADEIKFIIGTLDCLVASRYHSLVFAFSAGIPCLSISWSHKYQQLFSLFGMENMVVEYDNIKTEDLNGRLKDLFEKRQSYRESILTRLPSQQYDINKMFDTITSNAIIHI